MDKLKLKYRILIIAGVFLIAVVVFFLLRQKESVPHDEVYSRTLEESILPRITVDVQGTDMNCMYGHTSPVSYEETSDTLTLLPENRLLTFHIGEGGVFIHRIEYEIRSADLSELIDKAEVTDTQKDETGTKVYISVPNLVVKNKEYRLDISLDTQEAGTVHYYTRLVQTDANELAADMIELVNDFSTRNFNYDDAKENTTYVETDGTADDSTLDYTNLKSTFNNLAYNGLKLSRSADSDMRLTYFDGNTGEIHLDYMAYRDLSSGDTETFEISETYMMRMGLNRLYMLNYSRDIREVYSGNNTSGKRILLGINKENELESMSTGDGTRMYFLSSRDLWCYNSENKTVENIFSFRSNKKTDAVNSSRRHNMHMLGCDEDGNLTFLLYGYMNRGIHEGATGMALMRYDVETDAVTERFFLPVPRTYESIEQDIKTFVYMSESDIFYMKVDGSFYGIDTRDGNYITLAEGLQDGNYQISKGMQKLAWQEENDKLGSDVINIFDLETGKKQEIRSEEGTLLKAEGFIGRDIVISMHDRNNAWKVNGIVRSIPANAVEILDENLNVLKYYKRDDEFIGTTNVHDGRINMKLMQKTGNGSYVESGEDTIVSSTEEPERREDIGTYNDDFKLKVCYVQINDEIKKRGIRVAASTNIVDEGIVITGIKPGPDDRYYAYGDNDMLIATDEAATAINTAYEKMGSVRCRGTVIYCRPAMVTSRIIDGVETVTEDLQEQRKNGELFDLYGITLREALYYVSRKMPVLAYTDSGRALAIYAYDKTTVSMFDLSTKEREYWNQEEAGNMFARGGGDFSCDFTSN